MKQLRLTLSLLLLGIFVCLSAAAKDKIHVVFIGNSITYGATLAGSFHTGSARNHGAVVGKTHKVHRKNKKLRRKRHYDLWISARARSI